MNKNTNTQTDIEMTHMSLQIAQFFPQFFKVGKYLLPLLAGLFILAACGGGGAAPTTVTPDTTTAICATNVFDDACDAPDVETKRNDKITDCITGDAAGNADCKNAVEANDCLLDPFDKDCTAETVDETFAIHLEPAKKAREMFCREGNNNINNANLCGNVVSIRCTANPFDTICFPSTTYQDMRIAACSGATPPADSATLCTTKELTDIVCVATGAKFAPFNTTICGADDGVMNAAVRQEFCRASPLDNLCTNTISTFCATIDADKFTDSLCGTSASAAVRGTYCVGLQAGDRPGACGDDATEGSLIRAYCEGGSAEALLDTANNCATSLANACLTQPFGHACTTDANIRARADMCRMKTNGSNSCDTTRTVICEGGGVEITANIFDDLCDVGYDDPRRMACVNAPAPSVRALPSPKCGSEIAAGYLFDFCKTDDGATNNIHCPVRYAASGVRADRWQTDAVDADKNPLTPIPAGGASKNDALSNFIVGGEDGLDFVVGDTITQILRENNEQNDVRLDAVTGNNEDNKSGFGWARVRLAGAETAVQDKNYVGLLSGTDVGAPIRDNSKTGVWSAKGTIFLSEGVFPLDFILDVSFGPNTIETRATNLPSIELFGKSNFVIDGKFTNAGVIYGTTVLYVSSRANHGTLSGVIGADGAVGVFASNAIGSLQSYAGGFVATLGCPPGAPNPDCEEPTRTGNANYALWKWNAVKADKTPLSILPEVGQDDPSVNYIEAERQFILNRGFLLDPAISVKINKTGVTLNSLNLSLSQLGVSGAIAEQSGLTLYRPIFDQFAGESVRYYVGIWPGTDLGAPLASNTNTNTTWKARTILFLGNGIQGDNQGFDLEVDFGDKTIKTTNNNPISITHGSADRGTLTIDGKFTELGVIYGRSEFAWATDAGNADLNGGVSTGSLTGLIGEYGAVGAFISDGDAAAGIYVGGFVALNPNACDVTPFSAFCESTTFYNTERIRACVNDGTNTGDFADCPAFLAEICPISGARHADCPAQVQTGNADFILWKQDATDATNTNKLTVLDKLTGTTDPTYSYVEGRADGLELGDYFTAQEITDGLIIGRGAADNYHRILRLSDLAGGADNTGSGVAFREFTIRDGGNRPVGSHFYAGLLSGTDLGAPISATGPITTALWDARLELTILSVLVESNFTMEVNFDPNTIETRGGANAVALRAIGNNFGLDVTKLGFHINGKFTNTGVLYGTTTLTNTRSRTSVGLLTGLIGEKGAAGVFFTNDNLTRGGGIYVGGFVATPITSCEDYPFAEMCTTDADIREQLERCRDDIDTNGVGGCNATLNIICDVGSADAIVGDPFADPLCASSSLFDNVLVKACVGDETRIGDFAVCDDLIEEKCPLSGARSSECPAQVQTGNADFIRWKQDAVDTDGTTPLTILTEVGADDADENYVQAGADELNNDVLFDKEGNFEGTNSRISSGNLISLDLSDIGLLDDTASGMKAERYRYTGFTTGNSQKFYAGIFSGTDLGTPLTVNNTAETIWNAKFVMVDERGFHYTTNNDFTLEVNFTDKTIRTRAADPIALNFGTIRTGTIILNGKFTPAGVIYGTSRVELTDTRNTPPDEVLISDGSLTGLIGEKGAVGAFISDGDLDGAGRYAGGFVARNNSLCRGDTLFDIDCYKSPRIIRARADMCEGNMNVNGGAGGCAGTVTDICSDTNNSGSAINPFHGVCDTGDDTYDESRRLSCINNRDGYSGSSCADLTTRICITENKPLNTICADGTNTYDVPRQAACAGETVAAADGVCALVIAKFCTNNPFNDMASSGAEKFDCLGSDVYHVARQSACSANANSPDYDCTATIVQTCDTDEDYFSDLCYGLNFETYEQARIDICAPLAKTTNDFLTSIDGSDGKKCDNFLKATCLSKSFEDKCYIVDTYASNRLSECSGVLSDLTDADATPADCNRPELSGAICGTVGTPGTDPFAPICAEPTAVAADFVLLDVQHAFCRDGANINGQACADTVTTFCDVASGADLFDDLCMTGDNADDYLNYRVAACNVVDANNAVNSECGNIISTNCTGNSETDSPACAPAVGTLPTSVWVYTAPNADNTGRLIILDEAQLDDAADTNYVQGNATGLNLGELLEEGGNRKTGADGDEVVLSITSLDNVNDGDATGGVAFIRVDYDLFTSTTKVKYYAGLLDNVDLGAPLSDGSADGIWNASFSAIVNGAVQTDTDTSIVINFADNSLKTNDNDLVMLSGVDSGSITINARFNSAGVIYGTSSWTSGANSSTGSVTGLIGANGAIGAFVSSGENTGDNTDGEYVGGFVAAPVAECVGAVAFTNSLCDGPVGKAGRIAYVATCRTTDCTEFVNGMDGVMISDCTNRADGDPHQTGCESDNFDAERIARNDMCIGSVATYDAMVCGSALTSCLGSDIANNCGQLVGAFCDANASDSQCTDDESVIEAIVCRDLPLDGRCDTGYDEQRQTACAGETVPATREECKPVIADFCIDNPFNNAQSAGEVEFDCAGSDTYIEQRQMACTSENIAMLSEGDRCLPVISALCESDPFNNAVAGLGATTFDCTAGDTFLPERVVACKDNIAVNGVDGCDTTISDTCTADVFDNLCFDRVNDGNYGDYETARISYCQTRVFSTNSFTNDTVDSRTCAAFVSTCPTTPFDDKCKIVDNYASNRLSLCEGAIDDLTAAYATPAHCNTADFSGAICGAVNRLGTNPFAPICAEPTAVAGDFVLLDVQHAFCQDGANINGAACADTVTTFCDTASGASLFDVLCTTGDNAGDYLNHRVAACNVVDANNAVNSECGNIISTNCTGNPETDSPACTPAQGTLPTSVWLYTAPNANNTGRLKILAEVGTDDAYTNYVQGNATGLNLGVLLKENGTLREDVFGDETVLSITDLDNVDVGDAVGGVAFTRVSHNDFTVNSAGNKIRYYAGLLDNVDLGGPVPEATTNAIWNARFYLLHGLIGAGQTDTETTLVVNFDPNTIETRDVADSVTFSNTASISIRGKFTATGVIFGTSSWTLGNKSSAGSVTGLIGAKGAIGAFVSNGDNTDGEYAGGFVAAPVDCTLQTGSPFHRLCPTTPEEKTELARTCRMAPQTTGCDRVIVEGTQLTINSCTHSDMGNPYQDGCADLDGFAAEREARDLSCTGNDVYDATRCSATLGNCLGSITDTGCEAFVKLVCDANGDNLCAGGVPMICGAGGTDPLSTVCETGYDSQRHTTCAMQDINAPSDNRCAPIIRTLCAPDPFATAVGMGTTKINCVEADIYVDLRETACATQDIATLMEGDRCKPVIDRLCNDDPFATAAGVGVTKFDCTVGNTYQMVRDMKCTEDPIQLGCDVATRETACAGSYNVGPRDRCRAIVDYRCTQEPLNNAAGAGTARLPCAETVSFTTHGRYTAIAIQRVALCKDSDNRDDPLCQIPSTLAFITTCARDPWNAECTKFGNQYTTERTTCAAGVDPFADICGANDGMNNVPGRREFCNGIIDRSDAADNRCQIVTSEFCSNATGADLFNVICDADYTRQQFLACRENVRVDGECGTIIANNCPVSNTPTLECAVATTAVWENYSLNSDATGRLDILDAVGQDDPYTNYVKADADGLELGFVEETNGELKTGVKVIQHVLKLSEAGTTGVGGSGVAFARIDFDEFTENAAGRKERFYAGILSGTDLGKRVEASGASARWPADLSIIYNSRLHRATTSSGRRGELLIQFNNRIIENLGGLSFVFGPFKDRFRIYGRYTDSGVIYGTTAIMDSMSATVATGSLTGLIGQKGLVGIFASDGADRDRGQYVGGFVADNPNDAPDCTVATGEPFNVRGCPSTEQVNKRVELCQNRSTTALPEGIDADSDCKTTEVLSRLCASTETPFDTLCDGGNYDAERGTRCVADSMTDSPCGNEDSGEYVTAYCGTPTGSENDAICPNANARAMIVATCDANPLDGVCADAGYDAERQVECEGQIVDSPSNPLCAPVIMKVCLAEPFNPGAGAAANKLDCLNATSMQYVEERDRRITLCLAEFTKDDSLCDDPNLMAITDTCTTNPFATACAPFATQYRTARETRIALCADGMEMDNQLCMETEVKAITDACMIDPFDAVCTPFATQYSGARNTRLTTCRGKSSSTRGGVNCASALPTICAEGDTPFAQVCAGYDETQARIAQTCAKGATPDDPLCDTVVLVVSDGDDVLVKNCIENPYTEGCSNAAFYSARAAICESEATSFTAGCLTDSDFASNYRPADDAREAREALITRCTDSNVDNDEGCDTIIANSTTLLACIANPFLADCSGEVIASALANSPDAVIKRDALVTRCGDQLDTNDDGCDTPVGTSTIADCAKDRALLACSGGAFDAYIVFDCTQAANAFKPRCQDGIDGAVITARAELALDCAEDSSGTGCTSSLDYDFTDSLACNDNILANIMDSGTTPLLPGCDKFIVEAMATKACNDNALAIAGEPSTPRIAGCVEWLGQNLTVQFCNANPFLTGCRDAAFANARRVSCIGDSSQDGCSVAEGQGVTNYVLGDATELELDADSGAYKADDLSTEGIDENTELKDGVIQGGLTLNNLVVDAGNENHGFAFAYIPTGRGGDNTADRFYAGLLSGTDVGAEITADATWNGKIAIVSGLNGSILTEQADFELTIDFTDKTLKSGDIALPRLGGQFVINGKFAGSVIYGATSLRDGLTNGVSSIGSLTGLIGQNGAVGAFVSSGAGALVNTFGEYAGGFVASEGAPAPAVEDCSDTANLHPSCVDTPEDVDLCGAYDLTTLQGLPSPTSYEAKCIPVLQRLAAQETACAGETDLNAPTNPLCEAIITRVCGANSNLFNDEAGTGETKFDCLSVTRYAARRQQICSIPAYRNGATVELNGRVFRTAPIAACVGIIARDICMDNPFAQTIGRNPANRCDSTYDDDRKTACAELVSRDNPAPQKCFDTIERVCTDNPFDENFCYASRFDFTATRLRLCYADMNENGECGNIIQANCQPAVGEPHAECRSTRFTQWADDYNTDNSDPAVAGIPAIETKTARILLGRANGLDTETNVTSILAPQTVLRLKEGYSIGQKGNIIRAKGYESGIAVFSATTTNGTIGHYAGILSGTDVGAPLTDPAVNGVWLGDIAWVSNSDGVAFVKRAYDFTLNVNLNAGSISGSGITDALGRVPGYENTDILSLEARWKGNGILTDGITTLKTASGTFTGILTGMIGNAGVVGVFASNDGQAVAYAGGFIAKPPTTPVEVAAIPATATTWATNAPDVPPAGTFVRAFTSRNSSTFTTGLEDGLGLNKGGRYEALNYSLSDPNLDDLSEFVLRLNDTKGSAGYTSGVAFFYGNIGSRNNERFVAGLLSDTTVGANLPWRTSYDGVVSAIWGGRISGNFGSYSDGEFGGRVRDFPDGIILSDSRNEFTDTSFQLEINFETSTIKTPEGKSAFKNIKLRFDGRFDRNGIISGTTAATTHDRNRPRGNGVFSGIIGQDAAIGVFRSTDVRATGYVGGFIVTACDFDASNPTCKNNPSGLTAFCTNATTNAGTNPFHSECDTQSGIDGFRTTACTNNADVDTADESRCPGLLVAFCADTTANTGSNPWTDACAALATTAALDMTALDMARDTVCLNFGAEADKLCRGRGIIQRECTEAEPYTHVGCNTAAHINDGHRQAYCLTPAGLANPVCPNATSGDWVASFTDLNTDPDTTATAKNEFLQIVDKTISTTGTTMASNDAGGTAPTPTTLDFSQITLATPSMALNTDDGLAYFSGYQGSTLYYYAGIFGSTDLGAPIDADITATWTAMLSINGTETTFDLDVVFDGAEGMDNTVKGFITNPIDTNDLLIDGTFTANGVIEGDVHYAVFADETTPASPAPFNGTLSGLISAQGAVAVFVGTGYSGGFVAAPSDTANFGDWQGSFDGGRLNQDVTLLVPGTNVDGRLMNSAWFIELNVDNEIVVGTQTITDPTILRLDSTIGQEGYESGVAFWHGDVGATPQYYAGLLVGTDLGAPLTDDGKNGTWTGTIAGVTNGDVLTNTELKLQVMYGGTFANGVGTIKSIATGTTALGAVNVETRPGPSSYTSTFNFTGGFNAQGVIMGTVAHHNGDLSQNANGTFNGLIGVDGAVGVFKSNNNNRAGDPFGYIGGFIASPPPAGN